MHSHPGKRRRGHRLTTLVAAAPLTFAGIASAIAQEAPRSFSYGQHMWDGSGWFFGPVSMLVFLGIAILVVVLLVRGVGGAGAVNTGSVARPTPLDILRERYARGEVDKAEFEERKGLLGG